MIKEKRQAFTFRLNYKEGFGEKFIDNSEWYRDLLFPGYSTLEDVHAIIQQILFWDASHLFQFSINNRNYAYLGEDSLIVNDFCKGECYSCAIPLRDLELKVYSFPLINLVMYLSKKGSTFLYDFLEGHKVSKQISIVDISSS